jgi:lysozyme
MELSAAGLDLLKKSEGFCSRAYLDLAGKPTIGYGHRILDSESFPEAIEEAKAESILREDVRVAEQAVERLVRVPLSQSQFDALVDFCFNLGSRRLAGSTLLAELNSGRYSAAAVELLRWNHVGTEVNAGLTARREAEFRLWTESGVRAKTRRPVKSVIRSVAAA